MQTMSETLAQVFLLIGVNRHEFYATLITPEPVDMRKVSAAWTSAVRYTAKGLDIPDYAAAVARIKANHPSWIVVSESPRQIPYVRENHEEDTPEN